MPDIVRADSSVSLGELLEFIAQVVGERFRSTRFPISGAYLAESIRHRFPDFSYDQVGLTRLSEAVAVAEKRGLIARNRAVKHLEVFPRDVAFTVQRDVAANQAMPLHIRPDIWRAFIYVMQAGQSFYDRQSGGIVTSSDIGAAPDEGRFLRVQAIPLKVQQEWMVEFLRDRPQAPIHEAPIHDQYCFVKFPAWLREREPGLEKAWRQYRVCRVADCIREWAKSNSIDADAFFSVPSVSTTPRPTTSPFPLDERVIRAAVTMAANESPVEFLQDIAVPIRYVLRALQQSR